MLRVDPFTTYAYCCRICPLEFFTVFFFYCFWNSSGQMQKLYAYAAIWSTSDSPTKFLKTVTTRLPLHFISSLHCAPCHWSDCLGSFFLWPHHLGVFQTHQAAASSHLARSVSSSIVGRYRMQHLMCREEFCNLLHYHCVVVLFAVPGELSFTVSWFMIGFN